MEAEQAFMLPLRARRWVIKYGHSIQRLGPDDLVHRQLEASNRPSRVSRRYFPSGAVLRLFGFNQSA